MSPTPDPLASLRVSRAIQTPSCAEAKAFVCRLIAFAIHEMIYMYMYGGTNRPQSLLPTADPWPRNVFVFFFIPLCEEREASGRKRIAARSFKLEG